MSAILNKEIQPGEVLVVRYEGPAGGPGMQEMLHPTAFLKGSGLGKKCALITDGRFSGGSSGISVGHISPEAAGGGMIGLVENGDRILHGHAERRWSCSSTTRCWPSAGRRWSPPSGRGSRWTASVRSPRRCGRTPGWRRPPDKGAVRDPNR